MLVLLIINKLRCYIEVGLVEGWAALFMGMLSGSVPWYTMMVLHRRISFFQRVDDTLGVFHTHAVAGLLGGLLSGFFAKPRLLRLFYNKDMPPGLFYALLDGKAGRGLGLIGVQLVGAAFVAAWNVIITSLICLVVGLVVPLRMSDEDLAVGDDAAHGEEAYALWGDGEKKGRLAMAPRLPSFCWRRIRSGGST